MMTIWPFSRLLGMTAFRRLALPSRWRQLWKPLAAGLALLFLMADDGIGQESILEEGAVEIAALTDRHRGSIRVVSFCLILDHAQITITQALLSKLLENNTALITCDGTHHPNGLFLNLDGHTLQSQKFQQQINASIPLKKQLWQQTVSAKIANQARSLQKQQQDFQILITYSREVKSGDSENHEAMAAARQNNRRASASALHSTTATKKPPALVLTAQAAIF